MTPAHAVPRDSSVYCVTNGIALRLRPRRSLKVVASRHHDCLRRPATGDCQTGCSSLRWAVHHCNELPAQSRRSETRCCVSASVGRAQRLAVRELVTVEKLKLSRVADGVVSSVQAEESPQRTAPHSVPAQLRQIGGRRPLPAPRHPPQPRSPARLPGTL